MAQRSVASATINFGLVNIPVKLYVFASAESVSFNLLTRDGKRVKQFYREEDTLRDVDRSDLVKGYEHTKGQYVTFSEGELNIFEDAQKGMMDILEFVDAESVDFDLVEKSYHIGPNKGGEKAFTLLSRALFQQKKLGVAQWTNRGRQHLVIIAPKGTGLVLHQMYYLDEVRDFSVDIKPSQEPAPREMDMACNLIDSMSNGKFVHDKFSDKHKDAIMQLVDAKLNNKEIVITETSERVECSDLFASLQASLKKA